MVADKFTDVSVCVDVCVPYLSIQQSGSYKHLGAQIHTWVLI